MATLQTVSVEETADECFAGDIRLTRVPSILLQSTALRDSQLEIH